MIIKVNYTVSDVYMSTSISPVYIKVVYSGTSGGGGTWGTITGTLSDQTDLQAALDAKFDDPTGTTAQYLRGDGSLATFPTIPSGTVTSVGLSMPSAFSVGSSPITSSGTFAVNGAGTTLQYIDGTGALQTLPTILESDSLVAVVRNQSGSTMTKGTIVYISGATGNKPLISKALATSDATSAQTLGMLQTDIANNADGHIVIIGNVTDLDTSALTEGQQLYLSGTTAGTWTTTKPYAPIHLVYVGIVIRSHPTQGTISVKIQNGYELDEIHNVSAQTPSNNDGLFYESSTSLWKNKTIGAVLGYTPQAELTLTTTGTSGAATLIGSTLNIPQYSGGGGGSMAIGGAITSATAGSVLFAGASGVLAQDNANLFWDDTNNKLNVGTNTSGLGLFNILRPTQTGTRDYLITGKVNGAGTDMFAITNATSTAGTFYPTLFGFSEKTTINSLTFRGLTTVDTGTNALVVFQAFRINAGDQNDPNNSGFNGITTRPLFDFQSGSVYMRMFGTGNLILQNGGTFTDAGYRLDVNGTARVSGSTTFGTLGTGTGMYWDNTNNRLGIGTIAPAYTLDVNGSSRFSDNLSFIKNQNADTNITIFNSNDGNQARTYLKLQRSGGTGDAILAKTSNTYGTYKITTSGDTYLYNSTLGDIAFLNDTTTGKIKFATGGVSTAQMTLTAAGRLLLGTTTESTFILDVNGTARIVSKLSLNAGTTSNAQINLASSTAPTSPNNGDIWFDGTDLKMRIGGVTKTFTLV
jgi:hypothetical protein